MADGSWLIGEFSDNNARAMRVAEIMSDFRNLQYYLAQLQVHPPSPEDYYLHGYTLLRSCVAEAQAVLASPYSYAPQHHPQGDAENEKAQLRAVITDAAVRRFRCQRAYLQALAAMRWVNARNAILQGQRPHNGHVQQLQTVDHQLDTEVAAITDEQVDYTLRAEDAAQGKWLAEDPSLATIQQHLGHRR